MNNSNDLFPISNLNLPLQDKIKKYAKIKMFKAKSDCIKESVYIEM